MLLASLLLLVFLLLQALLLLLWHPWCPCFLYCCWRPRSLSPYIYCCWFPSVACMCWQLYYYWYFCCWRRPKNYRRSCSSVLMGFTFPAWPSSSVAGIRCWYSCKRTNTSVSAVARVLSVSVVSQLSSLLLLASNTDDFVPTVAAILPYSKSNSFYLSDYFDHMIILSASGIWDIYPAKLY